MKHRFSTKKAGYICYILIISMITCFFISYNKLSTYGYDERQAVVTGIMANSSLRLREDAGTGYKIVTELKNNTPLVVIGEKYATDGSLWYQVRYTDKESNEFTGYCHSAYIEIIYTTDVDFEQYLNEQGFPESYKPALRVLHEKYPNWVFKADISDYTWEQVLNEQNIIGRSLIANSSISSWKSTEGAAYNWVTGVWTGYDGAGWVQASKALIEYCLDPRNFLDEKYIFQFESLAYQSSLQNEAGVNELIKNTFMANATIENDQTYSSALMEAATLSGVSPYHLASSIIQEIGAKTPSVIISGTYSGYEGYYNYYNWGAYESGGRSAIENGLIYAKTASAGEKYLRPWDSRYKAIMGGAMKLGEDYINKGQNTGYYKKFNPKNPGVHQYMTHVLAAMLEGGRVSDAYTQEMKSTMTFVFSIPVYKDMPHTPTACPTKDGSPNNALKTLSVKDATLTPTFNRAAPISNMSFTVTVPYSTSSTEIITETYDVNAKVTGAGTKTLQVGNNKYEIKVTAPNGDVRVYTVTIIRQEGSEEETNYTVSLPKDDALKIIRGLSPKMSVEAVKAKFTVTNCTLEIMDASGNIKTTGNIGTGDKVIIKNKNGEVIFDYTFVLYGDVDGDGTIALRDALLIRKHNLGSRLLTDAYLLAGDVDRSGDGVNLRDALILRKYNLGQRTINQQ